MRATLKSVIMNAPGGLDTPPSTTPTTGNGQHSWKRQLVFLRGGPGSAELVIGPGDHTCEVHSLTLEQLKNLVADGADLIRKWET